MEKEKNSPNDILNLIDVVISEDLMLGYIRLIKSSEDHRIFSKEQLMEALNQKKIVYGVNQEVIDELAESPVFNAKIKVAEGQKPTRGKDGSIHYFVKRDADYRPVFNEKDNIDYKNLSSFQIVKKDQVLCEITKKKDGVDGKNIFGHRIPGGKGKELAISIGENSMLNEDGTKILSACDGVVRFTKDTVNIDNMLRVPSSVDFSTGNIDFSGDVTIGGDVCSGFSVKSNGNVIVRGVVEDAKITAAGNLFITNGINGDSRRSITVGKDLRCKYIENAILTVGGDISTDYIIDSKITCMGNIILSGSVELINGGEITLAGQLLAKEIGTERERITKINMLGIETVDTESIEGLKEKIQKNALQLKDLIGKSNQLIQLSGSEDSMTRLERLHRQSLNKKIICLRDNISQDMIEVEKLENEHIITYHGSVSAKKKLYRGVQISFGDKDFEFELENLERCKIHWKNGDIVRSLL